MAGHWLDLLGTPLATFGLGPKATRATFDTAALTAARTYTLPNGAGTLLVGPSTLTINNYLRAVTAATLEQRTPAQVLGDVAAMPDKFIVTATDSNYTYVAADANLGRGKTNTTARTYTVNASVLTVGAYYYAGNYASSANVTVAAASGTTLRLAGTTTTGSRTVAPFGQGQIWIRSTSEAWIEGPGVT